MSTHLELHDPEGGSIVLGPWRGPEGGYALWHKGVLVWRSTASDEPKAWILWCADGSGALAFTEDEADDLIAELRPGATKTPLFERIPTPPAAGGGDAE